MSDQIHYMKNDAKDNEDPNKPRVFLTPGYLKVLERKTYGLFRDLVTERFDPETRKQVREKLREVGPIGLFREVEGDETVEMRTVHPVSGQELKLKCISRDMKPGGMGL